MSPPSTSSSPAHRPLRLERPADVDRCPAKPSKARFGAGPVLVLTMLSISGPATGGGTASAQSSFPVSGPEATVPGWEPVA